MTQEYEGQYLIFNTRSKRLSFQKKAIDDKTHLLIGKVVDRVVNNRPVAYWLERIGQKKAEART